MIDKNSIERYLKQECTPEEANEVYVILNKNPDLLVNYLEAGDAAEHYPTSRKSQSLWNRIYRQTHPWKVVKSRLLKLSIAASILFIFGAGILLLLPNKDKTYSETATFRKPGVILKENPGNTMIAFHLPDGSFIKLMPHSTVQYLENFEASKRDILLNGEARFFVARDSARPFTVYSDAISTTALGTEFTVKSKADENKIVVTLYEGHVKVQKAETKRINTDKTNYLQPGDQLIYDKLKNKFTLNHRNADMRALNKEIEMPQREQTIQSNNWYMFNNQQLSGVLDQLQVLYNRKIYYTEKDLQGITFIGKIDKTDSLHKILASIALLNKLKVSKTADGYRIYK